MRPHGLPIHPRSYTAGDVQLVEQRGGDADDVFAARVSADRYAELDARRLVNR
jgi:hypothetical protein